MIALLSGQLAFKSIDHVIVDVGGVGYRLLIPLSSYYALPEHGPVRLHVHTHVREDALLLFGFLTLDEKELFLLLMSVSGVGPKLALNILSHMPAEALRTALAGSDVKRLSSLPGIGRKTAERLVLELKDKTGRSAAAPAAALPAQARPAPPDPREEALSALVNLGYKEAQARKALDAMTFAPDSPLEQVLKGALRILAS